MSNCYDCGALGSCPIFTNFHYACEDTVNGDWYSELEIPLDMDAYEKAILDTVASMCKYFRPSK